MKPVGEAGIAARLAILGHEESRGDTPPLHVIENSLQLRQDRDRDLDCLTTLLLRYGEHAILDLLAPHANDIASALPGVEREGEGEASFGADGVEGLEGGRRRSKFGAPST